jgi:hypothetical protein
LFEKLAEFVWEYLSKGSDVYVGGLKAKMGGQRRQPQAGNRGHWTKLIMLGPEKDKKQGHAEVGPVNDVPSSCRTVLTHFAKKYLIILEIMSQPYERH